MATKQEAKIGVFFLSTLSASGITFALTRVCTLMRWTPAAIACAVVGVVLFGLSVLNLALED